MPTISKVKRVGAAMWTSFPSGRFEMLIYFDMCMFREGKTAELET